MLAFWSEMRACRSMDAATPFPQNGEIVRT
jgi:hypothetical protein